MADIVSKLVKELKGIMIVPGEQLRWSPQERVISCPPLDDDIHKIWGLLHEAGHAKLNHTSYATDLELLQLEVAAWSEAELIAKTIGETIDPEHIQDCLDTYRDWLHQRSTCPRCGVVTLQESTQKYHCYNCDKAWTVTSSRFCRPYRLGSEITKNRPQPKPQTVFE